jgi:ornithine carbamoyltransferase
MTTHHFLDLDDLKPDMLKKLLVVAADIKKNPANYTDKIKGKSVALIFEKPSTRTRVSFEVGVRQLGGNVITLLRNDLQLGRGETVADTARVISRYIDMVMIRCYEHETLVEMAECGTIPVINGLSNFSHPCQIMADLLTYQEHRGDIAGKKVAWVGDCNNVLTSWMQASGLFKFKMHIASPGKLCPPADVMEEVRALGADITLSENADEAVKNADLVVTDTWVSMGETNKEMRMKLLRDYTVNDALMKKAKPDALFMHCLPAHRDEEVSASVIDGPQSVVWDEAENRLHVQKAIMLYCFGLL